MGGQAWDATARGGMSAVKDAYGAGRMGTMDYLTQVGKADAAGMDSPSVWGSRVMNNMGRFAGNTGKGGATNLAMRALTPQQQGYRPAPQVPAQQQVQVPMQTADSTSNDQQLADLAGRLGISVDELRRRLRTMQ
jgi:hypothetical protein